MRDYETGQDLSDEESANMTHLALLSDGDPTTFKEAVKSEKWRQAMDQEMQAIERNDTWELMALPSGGKTIGVKWVFKTKFNENGEVDKYKARLLRGTVNNMELIMLKYSHQWLAWTPFDSSYPLLSRKAG